MELSLTVAFTVGLFSTLHCLGMCGGIMGALSLGLAPGQRESTPRLLLFLAAYNGGRVASYAVAGGLMAGIGSQLLGITAGGEGHRILQVVAALIMVALGFHIAGWFPGLAQIERLGAPLWRRLEPLASQLLPVRSPLQALVYGALWGWLPCGLVYTMLLSSAAQQEPLAGALYMALFGLGTLPAMGGAGLLAGRIYRFTREPWLRVAVGLSLVAFGVITLWLPRLDLIT